MDGIKYRSADEMKESGIEWIGMIPRDWYIVPFKSVIVETSGNGFPNELQGSIEGDYPFFKVSDINGESLFIDTANNYVSRNLAKKLGWNIISSNSILTAKIGEALKKNHRKVNLVDCIIDNNMLALSILHGDMKYHLYFLMCVNMSWFSNPSTVPTINISNLRNSRILKFSKENQLKIANFLDIKTAEFDSIIVKKEQLIAKLEEAKKSLIFEVVTGKGKIVDGQLVPRQPDEMKNIGVEWLGKIPKDWNHSKIGFQFISYGGGTPSTDNLDYWYGEIPWVSSKDMKVDEIYDTEDHISDKGLFRSSAKKVPIGSLLIVMRSGILRNKIPVAITRTELTINQDLKTFIPKGMLRAEFLQKFIKCNEHNLLLEWRKQGATVESLEADLIDKFEIYYPDYDEQVILINWLNEKERYMNSIIEKSRNAICLYHSAKQSLITEAVTGKIDLREWEIIEQGGAS